MSAKSHDHRSNNNKVMMGGLHAPLPITDGSRKDLPTDDHMYLLPQSSHHPSLYRNIPFGVALRLRRICSRDDWFEEQLGEYHHFFKRRKYKNSVLIRPGTLHPLMPYCLNL